MGIPPRESVCGAFGISRIPKDLGELPPKFGLRGESAHFTIEVCAMPGEAGDYLYAAINQTLFMFAKVMKGVSPYDAADFLEDLQKTAPAGVSSVITRDHEAFGPPAGEPWEPKFPHRIHPFVKACRERSVGQSALRIGRQVPGKQTEPARCHDCLAIIAPLRRPLRFPYRGGRRKRPNGRSRDTSSVVEAPGPCVPEPDRSGNGRDTGASSSMKATAGVCLRRSERTLI